MMIIKSIEEFDFILRNNMSSFDRFDNKNINYSAIVPFGGKHILLIGDLLQLSPVAPGSTSSVAQSLITRCELWKYITLFVFISDYLEFVAEGNNGDMKE